MSSLSTRPDFAQEEEAICEKWKNEDTFKTQNRLSEERGDEVCLVALTHLEIMYDSSDGFTIPCLILFFPGHV